jgi:hypothetical protein
MVIPEENVLVLVSYEVFSNVLYYKKLQWIAKGSNEKSSTYVGQSIVLNSGFFTTCLIFTAGLYVLLSPFLI